MSIGSGVIMCTVWGTVPAPGSWVPGSLALTRSPRSPAPVSEVARPGWLFPAVGPASRPQHALPWAIGSQFPTFPAWRHGSAEVTGRRRALPLALPPPPERVWPRAAAGGVPSRSSSRCPSRESAQPPLPSSKSLQMAAGASAVGPEPSSSEPSERAPAGPQHLPPPVIPPGRPCRLLGAFCRCVSSRHPWSPRLCPGRLPALTCPRRLRPGSCAAGPSHPPRGGVLLQGPGAQPWTPATDSRSFSFVALGNTVTVNSYPHVPWHMQAST